jgi:hypothetical protein
MAKRKPAARTTRRPPSARGAGKKAASAPGRRKAAARSGTAKRRKAAAKRRVASKRPAPARATKTVRSRSTARTSRRRPAPSPAKTTRAPARPSSRTSPPAPARTQPPGQPRSAPAPVEVKAGRRATAAAAPRPRRSRPEPIEEPLLKTPTSFSLDLRGPRNVRAALEDSPFPADPDSAEALAAGDREVSLESAATVGDETPGGDNPTPDMDVVDLIGRSLGVEYEDNEELKGAEKIAARDRKRWELDPQSAEDYKDRNRS